MWGVGRGSDVEEQRIEGWGSISFLIVGSLLPYPSGPAPLDSAMELAGSCLLGRPQHGDPWS